MLAGIVAFLDSFFVCFKISMWSEWFTYMFSYSYSYNITVSLVLDRCKCNRNLVFQFYDGFLSYVSLACFCMISSCSYELLCIVWYCNNVFAFCLSGLNLFQFFTTRSWYVKFCQTCQFLDMVRHSTFDQVVRLTLRKSSVEMVRDTWFFMQLFFWVFESLLTPGCQAGEKHQSVQ